MDSNKGITPNKAQRRPGAQKPSPPKKTPMVGKKLPYRKQGK